MLARVRVLVLVGVRDRVLVRVRVIERRSALEAFV